jgi:hypothetical protein
MRGGWTNVNPGYRFAHPGYASDANVKHLPRHCEPSEAIQNAFAEAVWIASSLRSFLAMTRLRTQNRILATRNARVMPEAATLKTKGAGNAGCWSHPQPCVQV